MDEKIDKAIDFISKALDKDNLFPSFIFDDAQLRGKPKPVKEYFSSALIAMALGKNPVTKRVLDNMFSIARERFFTFFVEPIYPPDTDTNSLIFSLLINRKYPIQQQALKLLELIKAFSINGVAGVWLSKERRQRFDPIVNINAQVLAVLLGAKKSFKTNQDYIIEHLRNGNYLQGTRYYHSPDTFLYFVARLSDVDSDFKELIYNDFKQAIQKRLRTTCQPLDMAQRMIIGNKWGLNIDWEIEKLLSLQRVDGSLPTDSLFHFGNGNGYFASPALSTAFFVQALNTKTYKK